MRFLIALLALAGLVVSILALKVHNMDPSQAPPCKVDGKWDCGAVNHSRFAVLPPRSFDEDPAAPKKHIPIATLGIAAYSLIAFLSYLEAFVLEKWCIYCVWSQGLITAILLASIVAVLLRRRPARRGMYV
jgi:vitamin-K-epoxide reductase (warfarin-sensitive)